MEEILVNLSGDELSEYFDKNLVSIDEICNALSDLIDIKKVLEKKIKDLKQDIKDNYKPKSSYEIFGVSESDFN